MMKQIVKNYFGKAVMFILAIVMMISVALMSDGEGNIVYAAEDAYYIIESQTGLSVTDNMTAPKPTTEGKETYIFAGYFAEASCETPVVKSTDAVVYKKFVPAEIMNVKAQVTKGTKAETKKTDMRLVTTVDSLNYKEVGFDVYFNGATTPINAKTTTVYEKIVAAKNGNDFGYSPIAFAMDSDYFTTVNLVNIANKNFDKTFLIKPYWKTLDGTKVYGISRMARVSDSYNGIANIPVRIYENDITAENAISVTYDLTDFTYQGFDAGNVDAGATAVDNGDGTITCTTSQSLANVNDMLVNLKFKVNSTASSNESFAMSGAGACDYLYKGYATTYNGTPDTSWYNASQTEFVISSPAELYGFAKIVNDGTDNFKDYTVYMAADITINDMTVEEMQAALSDDSIADPIVWNSIGKDKSFFFRGTFDGREHVIKGLYTTQYGVFGWALDATIQKFSLKESYIKTANNAGSIVNTFDGIMDTVYSNATIHSTNAVVGGLIGRTTDENQIGSSGYDDSKFIIVNCWYDGDITQEIHNANIYCGGMIGFVVQGTDAETHRIQDSLHTGKIDIIHNSTKTINAGGMVGSLNGKPLMLADCLEAGEYSTTADKATKKIGSVVGGNSTNTSIEEETFVYVISEWNGNTVLGATAATKENIIIPESDYDNYKSYNTMSNLDYYKSTNADGYWVVRDDAVPALKSFVDEWIDVAWYYDNNTAGADTFTISTKEQLYGLSEISQDTTFSNEKIQLGKDIKVNSGNAQEWNVSSSGLREWKSIGNTSKRFAGKFDGQGHSLSGLYQCATADYSGLFASTDVGSEVRNLELTNSYFSSTAGYMGSIAGQGAGTFDTIYSDAIVEGAGTQIAGIIGRVNKIDSSKHTINNCWFDGKVILSYDTNAKVYAGGIVGVFVQGTLDITNCLNTGEVTHISDKDATSNVNYFVGGICGAPMNASCKLTIDNCMNAGVVRSVLKDGTADKQKIVSAAVGCANAGTTTIKGFFSLSEYCEYVIRGGSGTIVSNENLVINETDISGVLSYINAKDKKGNKLDFCTSANPDGEWVVTEKGIPTLKSFTDEWIDVAWYYDTKNYGEGNHSFDISTPEEFYGFSAVSQEYSFENDTVNLCKNVVLDKVEGREWTPIGNDNYIFKGNFNGGNHTISGLNVVSDGTRQYAGMFSRAINGTIKNFTLTKSTFTGSTTSAIGCVVGHGDGNLANIYCDESVKVITENTPFVGGIIGYVQDATRTSAAQRKADTLCTIHNCWFEGNLTQSVYGNKTTVCGGIVGYGVHGTIILENCLYTGNVDVNYKGTSTSNYAYASGLCGHHNAGSNSELIISSSLSAGTIDDIGYSKGYEASIVGKYGGKETYANVYATTECSSLAVGTGTSTQPITPVAERELYNTIKNLEANYWVAQETGIPVLKSFSDSYEIPENTEWLYESVGNETDPFVLSNAEALNGFGSLVNAGTSFKDEFVQLTKDIVVFEGDAKEWAKGQNLPTKSWTPIGTVNGNKIVNAFQGTFDGDGHTIRGLYVTDTAGTYLGLFRKIKDATVCNLRIENSYFNTNNATFIGSVAGGGDGTFDSVYSNAIVHGSQYAGGLIGRVSDTSNTDTTMILKNCHFDGVVDLDYTGEKQLYSGGLVAFAVHGSTLIDTCLYTGRISLDYNCNTASTASWKAYVGALCGGDNDTNGYVQVKNCISAGSVNANVLSSSKSPEVSVVSMNETIGNARSANSWAKNTYVFNNNTRTFESTGVTTKSDETFARDKNSLAANFDVDSSFEKETLYGYGAQMWTNLAFTSEDRLVADNAALGEGADPITVAGPIWAAVAGQLPVPATLAKDALEMTVGKPNTTLAGSGTQADPWKITSVEELAGFALNSKTDNYAGEYVVLTKDIIINEGEDAEKWVDDKAEPTLPWCIAIGSSTGRNGEYFEGIFDGQGHTISGICFENGAKNAREFVSLFATTEVGSVVKNLRIRNSYFEQVGTGWVGSVVGKCRGTVSNVYSDAIIKSTYENVGGIIAMADAYNYRNASAGIESRISSTVDNCWYAGEIVLVDEGRYSGGIIGLVNQGEWTLNNCVFTGKITCGYTGTSYAYVGGMAGALEVQKSIATSSKETKLTLNSCISAGYIQTENGDYGAGAFVGRTKANVWFTDDEKTALKEYKATHVVMNNVFATRDSGYQEVGHCAVVKASDSAGNPYSATPTTTGHAVWTNNADRLVGYCTEEVKDDYVGGRLDFTNTFVMREEGVPVPRNFTDLEFVTPFTEVDTILALATMDSSWTTKNAVNYGLGHYVLRTTGKNYDNYVAYLAALEEQGFAPYTWLEETGTDGVYNVIYTRETGEWVLNILFVQNTGKVTLTISNGFDSLSSDLEPEDSTTSGTVTLSMLQLEGSKTDFSDYYNKYLSYEDYYYGNSFVFKLPNGHFVINDGGNKADMEGLMKYLRNEAGYAVDDTTSKIYIDAWTVTHQHADHFHIMRNIVDNPQYAKQLVVNAIYLNEPNRKAALCEEGKDAMGTMGVQYRGVRMLKDANGNRTKVYWCQTGQTYYFDGLTMNILQSQEQIPVESYGKRNAGSDRGTDFNTASTNMLFTTSNGKKILITGDSNYVNMEWMMNTYGSSSEMFDNIHVYQVPHHGKNTSYNIDGSDRSVINVFTDYVAGDGEIEVSLFPCSVFYEYNAKHERSSGVFPMAEIANKHLIDNVSIEEFNYGKGTVKVTLGDEILAGVDTSVDTGTDTPEIEEGEAD